MVRRRSLGFVAKPLLEMWLAFVALTIFSGCGYHLKKVVRQSPLVPNGAFALETMTCAPMAQVQANYVTNIVSTGEIFFVGLATQDGSTLLYRVAPGAAVSCSRLPQPTARLAGGSDSIVYNP